MPPTLWTDRVLRAVDYIHTHLDEDLAPSHLAELAGFSRHHFHRVFRGLTGESVMGFVRRLRLERAAGRLSRSDAPVTEIALSSGYRSHEAFTRAFHARFGASPRSYRSTHDRPQVAIDVRFDTLPERTAIAARHVGSYDETGAAWARLFGVCAAQGLVDRISAALGLCYDDPDVTPSDKLRFDACLVFRGAPACALPDDLVVRSIPGGRFAIATHRGPYAQLGRTYLGLLGHSLPFRNVELTADPIVEHYVTDPRDTAPDDLVTEVCVRIA